MALEDLPDVPPAVPLLLSELRGGPVGSFADFATRFRQLLPELRSQSEWYYAQPAEASPAQPTGKLDIYLDGGLELFDSVSTCPSLDCRLKAAKQFSRSVGLLGDTVWLTDFLTPDLIDFGRLTDEKVAALINHTLVLSELEPLISAGILRFRPAPAALCMSCSSELERRIEKISTQLMQLFHSEFDIDESHDGSNLLNTGSLCYPPVFVIPSRKVRADDGAAFTNIAWEFIGNAVRRALWTAQQAAPSGGSVFSNSKVAMAAFAHIEGTANDRAQLRLLEASRDMTIPYVSNLTPAQIVQLRDEADTALPAFRESLARALEAAPRKPGVVADTMASLREQAAEVRGELQSTSQHAGRFWKTAYSTLGFGACAYGAASGNIPLALTGLLPLMQLMVSHKAGSEKDIDRLKRRPGYVLLKAQDILAHAH